MSSPTLDEVAAFDPEAVYLAKLASRRVPPEVLRLRGGEVFIASEVMVPMFDEMHRVLDAIVSEQEACEARCPQGWES